MLANTRNFGGFSVVLQNNLEFGTAFMRRMSFLTPSSPVSPSPVLRRAQDRRRRRRGR